MIASCKNLHANTSIFFGVSTWFRANYFQDKHAARIATHSGIAPLIATISG
jgi:hypothetical protein